MWVTATPAGTAEGQSQRSGLRKANGTMVDLTQICIKANGTMVDLTPICDLKANGTIVDLTPICGMTPICGKAFELTALAAPDQRLSDWSTNTVP
jgi:hypothetical protein